MLWALFLAMLFHLVVFVSPWPMAKKQLLSTHQPIPLTVSLTRPQVNTHHQIVSSETARQQTPASKKAFLSERDNSVAKETVHRGEQLDQQSSGRQTASKAAMPQQARKAPAEKTPVKKPVEKAATKKQPKEQSALPLLPQKANSLFLTTDKALSMARDPNQPAPSSAQSPAGSGAKPYGSSDYLPNIAQGEVTLLNTKAYKFSVFVRRVATRVFADLKVRTARPANPQTLVHSSPVLVQAELSSTGKLIAVKLLNSSGSTRLDELLEQSVNQGAWDNNPPAAALSPNGHYIFLFQASISFTPGPGGRLQPSQLLLETGLE